MKTLCKNNALLDTICEIDRDLSLHDPRFFAFPEPIEWFDERLNQGCVSDTVIRLYERACRVMKTPDFRVPWSPDTAFGEAVLNTKKIGNLGLLWNSKSISDALCPQAEMRLLKSLEPGSRGESERSFSRIPSVVLLDGEGEPFAIQKSNGLRNIYAWRTAEVDSYDGTCTIPADSFGKITYISGADPIIGNHREKMITFAVTPDNTDRIRAGRLSTCSLPEIVRRALAQEMVEDHPLIGCNVEDAVGFNPEAIGARVLSLLDQGVAVPA